MFIPMIQYTCFNRRRIL